MVCVAMDILGELPVAENGIHVEYQIILLSRLQPSIGPKTEIFIKQVKVRSTHFTTL